MSTGRNICVVVMIESWMRGSFFLPIFLFQIKFLETIFSRFGKWNIYEVIIGPNSGL